VVIIADRFWVGGGGNWSDYTNHWSDTSGGSPGATVPNSNHNAYFDANSFTASGQIVNIDGGGGYCLNMDWSGVTNTPTLTNGTGYLPIAIYGSLTLSPNMSTGSYGNVILFLFKSNIAGHTIDMAGIKTWNMSFDGDGSWTLLSDLIVANNFSIDKGNLNTGGYNISCANFYCYAASYAKSLVLNASVITISGDVRFGVANTTISAGTSTIKITGNSKTFIGDGQTFNNVEFQGTPTTITGSNTFNDLKISAGKTVNFTAGTTQTVADMSGNGISGSLITLQSTSAGTPYTISKASGTLEVEYYSIKDCTASGGATFNAVNSTNVSGNTGWSFSYTLHLIANALASVGLQKSSAKALSTSTVVAPIVQKSVAKSLLANAITSSAIQKSVSKTFASLAFAASFASKTVAKSFSASANVAASTSKTVAKTLTASVITTASVAKSLTKSLVTSASSTASIVKQTAKTLIATVFATANSGYIVGDVIGTLTDAETHMFGFNNKLYIMNGTQYKVWDGTTLSDVAGYVPIVATAAAPATGTGTSNEQVNKLIASQYIWYSGTVDTTVYQLPATSLTSVDAVYVNDALQTLTTHYTVNLTNGTVTFGTAPGAGTNNVKIRYTKTTTAQTANRALILAQKYSEMFNGKTDNRIFLYGDGTNKAYYSGIEYATGRPTAEYFPDLNVLDIGTSNTPVTALTRHFNKLMAFKTDGTYLTEYGTITLEDDTVTAGFYTSGIDRDTGNTALGQVRLVNNYPIAIHGNSAYRWGLLYSSGVQDERSAKRISDHVANTLSGLALSSAITFDDDLNREFWIVQNGTALIWNYAGEVDQGKSYKNNTWSIYNNIPASCFAQVNGDVYFGTTDGRICKLSTDYHSDDGTAINAYWESGSMSFDKPYMRKVLSYVYTVLKPEVGTRLNVTLETDKKSDFDDKLLGESVLNFTHIDFNHFSFSTNYKPRTNRTKLKAKKFTTLKLIFSSNSASATATVLSCSLPVTETGYTK